MRQIQQETFRDRQLSDAKKEKIIETLVIIQQTQSMAISQMQEDAKGNSQLDDGRNEKLIQTMKQCQQDTARDRQLSEAKN